MQELQSVQELLTLMEEQEQMSSSEISRLQSALQQAQKKLQEQSEQIVRLSEADLILEENRSLKEENAKLRSEKEEIARKAASVAEADKARFQDQERDLCRKQKMLSSREKAISRKEQELSEAFSRQEEILRRKVENEASKIRWDSDAKLREKQQELSMEYDLKERRIKRQMKAAILYGVVMTALLVVASPLSGKLKASGGILAGWMVGVWNMLNGFADRVALNSLRIPWHVPHQLLYHVIRWGIIGIIAIVIPVSVLTVFCWLVKRRRHSHMF